MKTKNTKKFWMLFRSMPHVDLVDEKDAIVLSFTNDRTTHIGEMTMAEFQPMLSMLEGKAVSQKHATLMPL